MPELQNSDYNGLEGFRDLVIDQKGIYEVYPKMSEYIELMATYLLHREKKVVEKSNLELNISG